MSCFPVRQKQVRRAPVDTYIPKIPAGTEAENIEAQASAVGRKTNAANIPRSGPQFLASPAIRVIEKKVVPIAVRERLAISRPMSFSRLVSY